MKNNIDNLLEKVLTLILSDGSINRTYYLRNTSKEELENDKLIVIDILKNKYSKQLEFYGDLINKVFEEKGKQVLEYFEKNHDIDGPGILLHYSAAYIMNFLEILEDYGSIQEERIKEFKKSVDELFEIISAENNNVRVIVKGYIRGKL